MNKRIRNEYSVLLYRCNWNRKTIVGRAPLKYWTNEWKHSGSNYFTSRFFFKKTFLLVFKCFSRTLFLLRMYLWQHICMKVDGHGTMSFKAFLFVKKKRMIPLGSPVFERIHWSDFAIISWFGSDQLFYSITIWPNSLLYHSTWPMWLVSSRAFS